MEEPLLTGRTLGNGRYAIGERLGAGGWGAVYAAVQTDLGRRVAIKVLHTSVALSGDGLVRFEREAKAAAALGHPNIAQVSDFQANPGEPPFLVMELLLGSPLGGVIREAGKLPPARMAWIAYQMLAGLDVAHKAGIVHRDIKPDNVFLVSMTGVEDFVKLLDFGIAKLSGDKDAQLTATGTMLGSPAFMAPEQIRTNQVDHRVDLYAAGATMYVGMSGRMPFEATTVHGLLLAITQERPTPLHVLDPSIDPAMSALVERAMAKDPPGRFASAADMRAALEPWLGGVPGHARAGATGLTSGPATSRVAAFAAQTYAETSGPVVSAAAMTGPPPGSPPPGTPPPGYHVPPPAPQFAHAATPPPMMHMTPAPAAMMSAPPAPARGNGAIIALLGAIVVLLLVGLGGGGYFFYTRQEAGPTVAASANPPPAGAAAPASAAAAAATAAATATGAVPSGAPAPAVAAAAAPGAAPKPKSGVVAAAPQGAPAPAAVANVVDAGAAGPKQMAGTRWSISGGTFDKYEIEPTKAAVMRVGGAISACYVATEFEPPDHQFTNWTFQIDPLGNVRSVGRTTSFAPHPKLDVCMIGALRQVKFAAVPGGGSIQLSFSARTRDNP